MRRLADFWALFSIVVVLGGALLALCREFNRRRRQLSLEKAAFLTEIHQELEHNPAITRAVALLKDSNPVHRLESLLAPEVQFLDSVDQASKSDLDALFRVLNRIAHAVCISRIVRREEAEVFSWYFRLIQHHPVLAGYFYDSGFLDLWDYSQSLLEKDEVEV
jgi:hypothetical protein